MPIAHHRRNDRRHRKSHRLPQEPQVDRTIVALNPFSVRAVSGHAGSRPN